MAMYPVIKIPPLISRARNLSASDTKGSRFVDCYLQRSILFHDEASERYRSINNINLAGYLSLFLSAVIFIAAIFIDRNWLNFSFICFFLWFASLNLADLIAARTKKTKRARPTTTSSSVESIPSTHVNAIDWDDVLAGKLLKYGAIAQAQVGVSEAHFERYLKKYFGDYLKPGYEFELNDRFKYSNDFTLILPKSISLIIEVDEPYEGRTKKPHHCKDDGKDDYRDKFFLKGNWIVIRFSEFQVCAFPDECCYQIAKTIDSIDPQFNFANRFVGIGKLPLDRRWSEREAKAMAKRDYRLDYLKRYNIYTQIENTDPKKPSSKVKTSKRK
jgi:very-short-patch-repair endonuclease